MNRRFVPISLAAAVLAAAGIAAQAYAVNLNWINNMGGSAATASNWAPAQVPGSGDALFFPTNGSYGITFNAMVPQTTNHIYRVGTLTLDFQSPHVATSLVQLGFAGGDAPRVTINSGTLQGNAGIQLAGPASTTALLTVRNSGTLLQAINAGSDLVVGNAGSAELNIQSGALLRVFDDAILGGINTGVATVTVTGSAGGVPSTLSTHNPAGDLLVGNFGQGTLFAQSGANVAIEGMIGVGILSPSIGRMTVSGSGTTVKGGRLDIAANSAINLGGDGLLTVSGGRMTVARLTRIGDPHGGTGVLRVNGGTFETDSLTVDATHGSIDLESGILRIASGGVGTLGTAPFTHDGGTFVVRDSASVTRTLGFNLGPSGSAMHVKNRGSVTCAEVLMTDGNAMVSVDSSSTLNISGRLHLMSSGIGSLNIGRGSTVQVGSFETADEGGSATITLSGNLPARLVYSGTSYVGGDEADHGGATTVFVQPGGSIEHVGAGTSLVMHAPSNMIVSSGGSLSAGDSIYVKGLLQVYGTITSPVLRFLGNGRMQGQGALPCDLSSSVTTTMITAFGNLALGRATTSGWQFQGSLFCGAHAVSILDTNGFTLGDTTVVAGGSLSYTGNAIVPAAGTFIGRGAVTGNLSYLGKLSVESANPGTLTINGNLVAGAGSTTALKVTGRSPGQADLVQATGNVACAATLDLTFTPGAVFLAGDVITILSGATRSGTFGSVVTHGLPNPAAIQIQYTANAVRIQFLQTVDVGDPSVPLALAFSSRSTGNGAFFELALPEPAFVTLEVFDVTGRRVALLAAKAEDAGVHRYAIADADGARWMRGVYFGRVRVSHPGSAGTTAVKTAKVVLR